MITDKDGVQTLTAGEEWSLILNKLVGSFLVSFVSGWIGWMLWNGIVADIFHAPNLTYWQMWGVQYLILVTWPHGKQYVLKAK